MNQNNEPNDGACKDHASKKKLREVVRHGDTAAVVEPPK